MNIGSITIILPLIPLQLYIIKGSRPEQEEEEEREEEEEEEDKDLRNGILYPQISVPRRVILNQRRYEQADQKMLRQAVISGPQ